MKGWKLVGPNNLIEQELDEQAELNSQAKVKITKSLITLSDVLRYKDELDGENVVLGSSGIGVISESETNLFGLEKGKRVYIEPVRECLECQNCKSNEVSKCSNINTAGIDIDGFLRDFI